MTARALSPAARTAALAAMRDAPELDVLIVGGGVVGAGAALDAATRGLSTAIVEARDWASGTSSRSSKLIHGGLRYLEMLDFGLVREALHERGLLIQHIAPHLIRPVPFLYPLTHRVWERPYVGAGVLLYDTLGTAAGSSRGLPHHRHLSRRRALREAPCLAPDSLTGAVQYWDAQVDDARHTMTVVRTAASFGALAANRTRVVGFLPGGRPGDRCPAGGPGDRRPVRGAGQAGHQRHRRVDRRDPGAGRRPWPVPGPGVQGRAPGGAAGPAAVDHRAHPAHRDQRAVRDPVGPALDHRHHRHRLEPGPGAPGGQRPRHRLPARAGEHGAVRAAEPRRRGGCLRRAPAVAVRGVRARPRSCPASTWWGIRCRGWWWWPAASTPPTG